MAVAPTDPWPEDPDALALLAGDGALPEAIRRRALECLESTVRRVVRRLSLRGDISAGGLSTVVAALVTFFMIGGPNTTLRYEWAAMQHDLRLLSGGFATQDDPDPTGRQAKLLRRSLLFGQRPS
jgi:hypothetical protein